jgi:hypothetical protein
MIVHQYMPCVHKALCRALDSTPMYTCSFLQFRVQRFSVSTLDSPLNDSSLCKVLILHAWIQLWCAYYLQFFHSCCARFSHWLQLCLYCFCLSANGLTNRMFSLQSALEIDHRSSVTIRASFCWLSSGVSDLQWSTALDTNYFSYKVWHSVEKWLCGVVISEGRSCKSWGCRF